MSEVKEAVRSYSRKLVLVPDGETGGHVYAVPVSHKELDSLIGRLMQMCDLIGDVEQRTALKSTIKQINRDWLDNLYEESGYERFTGKRDGVEAIEI